MAKVLITGSKGQLGQSCQKLAAKYPSLDMLYMDVDDLDITEAEEVNTKLAQIRPDVLINAAAYTSVDQAESLTERHTAALVNEYGPKNLAEACSSLEIQMIHVSTDFVFDGKSHIPYIETDKTNPLGIYGKTKESGEFEVMEHCPDAIIIRTSWLYSEYGGNFLKTMLRLGKERDSLNIVFDQVGTPTYAEDLAALCMEIAVKKGGIEPGIYHYSNEGVCSWYDFAHAIFELAGLSCSVQPIEAVDYPTPAKRPHYSVLNKGKIRKAMDLEIPHWRESLKRCLQNL